jgi:hypothetical protein
MCIECQQEIFLSRFRLIWIVRWFLSLQPVHAIFPVCYIQQKKRDNTEVSHVALETFSWFFWKKNKNIGDKPQREENRKVGCWGIRNRAPYSQNHKPGAARREQFVRLIAKPSKPINTILSFVAWFSLRTLRRPKVLVLDGRFLIYQSSGLASLFSPTTKPRGRIFSVKQVLAHISLGGFVAANDLYVWSCLCCISCGEVGRAKGVFRKSKVFTQ